MERQNVSQAKRNRLSELPQNQRFWPDEGKVSIQYIVYASWQQNFPIRAIYSNLDKYQYTYAHQNIN